MPRTPCGFYRPIWQAQDVMGCPRRTYPACAMDVVGRKVRGDHIDAIEFGLFLEYASNNNPATIFEYGQCPGVNLRDFTICVTGQQAGRLVAGYHYWGTFYAADEPCPVAFFFHDAPGHNNIYDLRTMAAYTNLPGAFPAKFISQGNYAIMCSGDAWGDPWLNPI